RRHARHAGGGEAPAQEKDRGGPILSDGPATMAGDSERPSLFLAAADVQAARPYRSAVVRGRLRDLRGLGGCGCIRLAEALPLLDQLADLLAALVTNLRVELGTTAGAHALSALLADLLVELVPALRLDGLAALLADLLVEGPAALLRDLHASLAPCLGNRHPALLLVRHLLPPVVGRIPPPLRRQPPRPSRSVSCLARSAP